MSEKITANNLANIVNQNSMIHAELIQKVFSIQANCNTMQVRSSVQFAFQLLKPYGLIQLPIENQYWSGAIFVKNGLRIPVLNTALPRANQYFAAWHEIYHLFFDEVSFDHVINTDIIAEERKAEYFASLMLLGNLMPYFGELPDMDFLSKIFHCMDIFQAPYKAVLISLYESASKNGNEDIKDAIIRSFDLQFTDLPFRFRSLGLDDTLVKPSYVVNLGTLQSRIRTAMINEPELRYHQENNSFLQSIVKELNMIIGDKNV